MGIKQLRTFARRLRDERGTSLIEVMVAIFILAIAVTGVIGSMGGGMNVVGHSRQRSSASAVAKEKIERLYNTDYDGLALNEQPSHSTDESNPDFMVEGSSYRTDASAPLEPLVTNTPVDLNPGFGAIPHYEDPVTLGKTDFNIYQYVTWVDDPDLADDAHDPDQDYKRVVVVVTWKNPVQRGVVNRVVETTFVSDGTVEVPPPPTPSPTPEPTPTPPPFPPADPTACLPEDAAGPNGSMEVVSGTSGEAGYTSSTLVEIVVTATDACTDPQIVAAFSNDGGSTFTEVAAIADNTPTTLGWTVPPGNGTKVITVRFRDAKGNVSETSSASITLDETKPTPSPGLAKASCNISGNPRVRVNTLSWTPSTDANFVGYRVMRSVADVQQGAYQQLLVTSSQTLTDTNNGEVEVKFQVIAYDKAGNSEASNEVVYRQKSCN